MGTRVSFPGVKKHRDNFTFTFLVHNIQFEAVLSNIDSFILGSVLEELEELVSIMFQVKPCM
jgi:hypothetical protein